MTVRHLRIFIAVADTGGMRRAAEALYISQPSVSQAIKEMEEHYNIRLFERLSSRLCITEAGKALLPYARHAVSAFDDMEERAFREGRHGRLRAGASVTVGTVIMPEAADKCRGSGIDVSVTVDNTAEIERGILMGELDIAVVEGVITSPDITAVTLCRDEVLPIVGLSHPYSKYDVITADMLNGQPLISREKGSAERNQFEHFLLEQGIEMERKWSCSSAEAIKNAVAAGLGIALMSERLVTDPRLRVLHIDGVSVKREFRLIHHKNKFISKEMEKFSEILFELFKPD